jgi:hypothetical protein
MRGDSFNGYDRAPAAGAPWGCKEASAMIRVREYVAGVLLVAGLFGCQARQMVNQYADFDAVVTDLYDKHVLYNLARREAGRTMVQIEYKGFSANLNTSTSMSGQVQFFTNPQNAAAANGAAVSLNSFQQMFQPTLSNSTTSGLAINSAPAGEQEAIRGLYEEQVARPEEERIYQRTTSSTVAMRSYCWVKTAQGELYFVPADKQREFSDFVHRVSFYKAVPGGQGGATSRPVGASVPGVTTRPAGAQAARR